MEVESSLRDWDEIKDEFADGSILIGNGLSRSIDNSFRYESLVSAAESNCQTPLEDIDLKLFDQFGTSNFEEVLGALLISGKTLSAVAPKCAALSRVEQGYDRIRESLIEAVHHVHIARGKEAGQITDDIALQIGQALSTYKLVFTTNYDLILYWSLRCWMERQGNSLDTRDHFHVSDPYTGKLDMFDLRDARQNETNANEIELFFLHGALHLFRTPDGQAHKLSNNGQQILKQFYKYPVAESLPLFISEGDADNKLRAIRDSEYLRYALTRLEENSKPLVVFGHSLSDKDKHIREAIGDEKERKIAISIRSSDEGKERQRMAQFEGYFSKATPEFFRADSHPLGSVGAG